MINETANGFAVLSAMCFNEAAKLLKIGCAYIEKSVSQQAICIDLARVPRLDSSALACIFAWMRVAKEHQKIVQIQNPPAPLLALASLYDVRELLD